MPLRIERFQHQGCCVSKPRVGVRNERLPWDASFNEPNHKVVPAFVSGWLCPILSSDPPHAGTPLEFKIWIILIPGVAVNGNPGLEDTTPLVLWGSHRPRDSKP